jgi:hypothetical protein
MTVDIIMGYTFGAGYTFVAHCMRLESSCSHLKYRVDYLYTALPPCTWPMYGENHPLPFLVVMVGP